MNYSDFKLAIDTNVNTISILPGYDVNVSKYISIEDKNDIVQLALQESDENGLFNLFKLHMFFELYIVYMYTDINFTIEEKDDPTKLYDELKSSGILDAILNAMEPSEYEYLKTTLDVTMKTRLQYRNTIASVLNNFVQNLPINAQAANDIINKFDPASFQKVIDFAMAANGNRPIN